MSLESNELLSNAASVAAAGETLGLSPDEAFAVRGQTLREAQRRQRAERNQREGNRAEAEAFLRQDEREFRAKGQLRRGDTRVSNVRVDEDYPDPFGGQEQRIYRDDGSLQEIRDLIEDEQTLNYEERLAKGLEDGTFNNDSPELRQERGGTVVFNRGTPAEERKWREGRYVTQAGKPGARDRANRPARPALFNAPEQAIGRRQKDLANPALRQLAVRDPRSYTEQANAAVRANADQRGEARKAQEGVSRSELEARIAKQARQLEDLARGVSYYDEGDFKASANAETTFVPREIRNPNAPAPARFQTVDPQQARLEAEAAQRSGVNLDAAKWNSAIAAIEADQIARTKFGVNGPGSTADEAIGRIGEIRKIGIAGKVGHGPDGPQEGNFQVVLPGRDAVIGDATPLMRGGQVVGYYGMEDDSLVELGEINTPDSANALNAPTPTKVQAFAAGNLPDYAKPGGLTFAYPEVNISESFGRFGERMRRLPNLGTEQFPNPTSLPELEAAVDSIVARQQQLGEPFFKYNAETRKTQVVPEPGIEEVLYKMRYTDNEVTELANALYQSDMARMSPVNQERKADLRAGLTPRQTPASDVKVRMESEVAGADDQLQRFRGEKVGKGKKRQGVGAAIRAIDGNEPRGVRRALEELNQVTAPAFKDAPEGAVDEQGRKVKFVPDEGRRVVLPNAARDVAAADAARGPAKFPFQAALASEEAPRANFISGSQRGRGEEALIRQFGPENGRIAAQIEQRYLAAEEAKGRPASSDSFASEQRAIDDRFAKEREVRLYRDEERARGRLGANVGGRSDSDILRRPTPVPFVGPRQAPRAERESAIVESVAPTQKRGSWMGSSPEGARVVSPWGNNAQPIQAAAVPQSIAPDPWAGTGSAPRPQIDAGGGMSGGQPPRKPPTPALPYGFSQGAPQGPQGGGRTSSQRAAQDRQNFSNEVKNDILRRRNRTGIIAGGGTLAALAGVLGLSNMGNEEEEQMR